MARTTTPVPFLFATIKADHAWVNMLQYVSDDESNEEMGHFDPYTGEPVQRATGYPPLTR